MKKIIATVLAMVMALALCTVAFADATAITEKANVPNANTGDTVAHDVSWNNTEKDLTAAKVADDALTHGTYWYSDNTTLFYVWDKDTGKFVQITDDQRAVIIAGYDKTNKLVLDKNAAAATCSDAGYLFNVYSKVDGSASYVLASDVKAYNDKQTNAADKVTVPETKYYFGTSYSSVVAYYVIGVNGLSSSDYLLAPGHVLVKDGTTYGTAKADVYKCALCGNRYVVGPNADTGSLKSEAYTYDATTVANYANANGILLKNILRNNATLYLVEAGTTTGTTDGTTTSPKTFDAGIAMYVGMALTSVAGSAVVIGKKKEF